MNNCKLKNFFCSSVSTLKSSTLIEVVVAMIIITIFTGIFFDFLTKARRENNIELKVDAQILINNAIDSAFINKPTDTTEIFGAIRIIRKEDSTEYKDINRIVYKAFNNSGKLLAIKNIFIKTNK
jgi:type II secretory pathway pseudopilin PulG